MNTEQTSKNIFKFVFILSLFLFKSKYYYISTSTSKYCFKTASIIF